MSARVAPAIWAWASTVKSLGTCPAIQQSTCVINARVTAHPAFGMSVLEEVIGLRFVRRAGAPLLH